MSDEEDIKEAVHQWLKCLDAGDLHGMLETCDPDCIVANERTPTTIGVDHLRLKYAPRIAAATFRSGFDFEHIAIYTDFALVMGRFDVEMADKATGAKSGGSGRLALGYRRHANGAWKMVFDMDNNA